MARPGKKRRSEDQFTAAQRAKMYDLWASGYGIEAVMERYGLSEQAADEYVMAERAARRAKDNAATDWAAKFRAAG